MTMGWVTRTAATVALYPLIVGGANAASATFTGTLRAAAPVVAMDASEGDVVARVKPFNLTATISGVDIPVVTSYEDAVQAHANGDNVFLLEWSHPTSLAVSGETVSGVLDTDGPFSVGLTLSMLSGPTHERVVLLSEARAFTALMPQGPVISEITTLMDGTWVPGAEITNYRRNVSPQVVTVKVEPRNYLQTVSIDGMGTCEIPDGMDNCFMPVAAEAFPAEMPDTGNVSWPLLIDATNGGLLDGERLVSTYGVTWDFRGPTILAGKAVGQVSGSPGDVLEVDGHNFTVDNGEVVVVVSSPHVARPDAGWVPAKADIVFRDLGTQEREYTVTLDGYELLSKMATVTPLEDGKAVLAATAPDEQVEDYYAYRLPISSVPDGDFAIDATVYDANGNPTSATDLATVSLARSEPEIHAFYNYTPFTEGQDVYFYENVVVAGYNGIKGGTTVTGVTIDGQPAALNDGVTNTAWLAATNTFAPGQTHAMEVTIQDQAGHTYTKTFNVNYMPADWQLTVSSPTRNVVYRDVQSLKATAKQTGGAECPIVPTEDLARKMTSQFRHYCVFRWDTVPAGFEANYNGAYPLLMGAPSVGGDLDIGFSITMFNHRGGSALAAVKTASVAIEDAPAPTLVFDERGRLSNGMYPIGLTGGQVVKARATTVSADVALHVGNEPLVTRMIRGQDYRAEQMRIAAPGRVPAGNLWDVVDVPAKLIYTKAEDRTVEETAQVVYVPQNNVRIKLDILDDHGLTTTDSPMRITLGQYNSRTREWSYDASRLGEWTVYLATNGPGGIPQPLTDVSPIGTDGTAEFVLATDLFDLTKGGGVVFAVADLESPIDGYKKQLISNKRFFRVYKGEEVEGTISGKGVIGPVPLLADVRYSSASKADADAVGRVEWEQSLDAGATWAAVPGADARSSLKLRLNTDTSILVRAAITNKFTNAVSYTEPLSVIAYSRPELAIKLTNVPLKGESAELQLMDGVRRADPSMGTIEWSLDDGATWTEDLAEVSVLDDELTSSNIIMARMQYYGAAEDAGERAVVVAKLTIPFREPQPPRVSTVVPREVEVGTEMTLKATATPTLPGLEDRVRIEWTLPSGEQLADSEIRVVAEREDVIDRYYTVTLSAWIDGKQADTRVDRTIKVRTWEYQFPTGSMSIPVVTRYAPSTFKAFINVPRVSAPGVTFSYDWSVTDGGEVVTTYDRSADIKITEPGIHTVSAVMRDNRGNEQEMTQLVEVLEPEPMQLTITPAYSTAKMRYPLDVISRVSTKLGHPSDTIKAYRWYHNGEMTHEEGKGTYRQSLSTLAEGSHTIEVEVESLFGQIGRTRLDIEVVPNVPPECTLKTTQSTTSITFDMACSDEDGKIARYEWFLDGEPLANIQRSITLSKAGRTTVSVTAVAHDDSWATTTKSETVNL